MKFPLKKHNLLFGRHSNFPDCCIQYFTDFWEPNIYAGTLPLKTYERVLGCAWGYIPCPECLESGNRVQVHRCTEECRPFLVETLGFTHRTVDSFRLKKVPVSG